MTIEDRINVTTLANGLRVVTEHMPHVQSAAIGVWVNAGSRNETPEQGGISHMLEHMAFKGTARRSARQIVEEIEDVGGDLNAYTDFEITAYQARLLSEHVPLAIDIIADILRESTFLAAEIERERHVILQEIGERNDMPSMVAMETLQEVAFTGQALGRPIIGTPETVMSFDEVALRHYLDTHYCPSRMILGAAGHVDHAAIVKQAESLFADLPRRDTPPVEAAKFHRGSQNMTRETEQAHVVLGFPAPDYRDIEAQFRAQTAAAVLGGGMSSRLFQEAREERGLCYSIYSYCEAFNDAGMMTIYGATAPEQAEELATLALQVAEQTASDITDREASRARAQSKAGLLMGLESPMRRAETLARQVFLRGRPLPMNEIVDMIDAVDASSVQKALAEIVGQGERVAVYLGPDSGGLPTSLHAAA